MYILKNAITSITRNSGRNILMGIIILVISCSCCITLSIRNSATKLVNSYIDKYDIEASISMNRQNLMGSFNKGESSQEANIEKFNAIEFLTEEEIETYGDSKYVSSYYYTSSFSLNSSNIESAKEEIEEKGLSEYYQVTTNLDTINSETESIQNVSNFASTFLVITLLIGAVVLFVINMINVRERKYEIGVLRTIGMKKIYVILQFVLELLMVSTVSLLLGAGIGSILSVPTANKLLENEINSSQEQMNNISENFGKPGDGSNRGFTKMEMKGVVKVEQVSSIHAAVDLKVLIELLGIGMILTLISSISAITSIARFSPITILKERS